MLHMCVVQGQITSYGTSRCVNEGSSVWWKYAMPSNLLVLCSSTHQTLHAVVLKRQYLFRHAAGVCSKQSRKWRCMHTLCGESKCPALAPKVPIHVRVWLASPPRGAWLGSQARIYIYNWPKSGSWHSTHGRVWFIGTRAHPVSLARLVRVWAP
jgi:hypothetical protein